MFRFFRKNGVEGGAQKALKEAGLRSSSYIDYFNLIKGLGFLDALDASRDALSQSMQSICFAFATLELMKLRCQLHGQDSNMVVINESQEYLAEAIRLQISLSDNPDHSERNANILLETVMKDARNFLTNSTMSSSL
jgi:hypothetical protein